MDGKIQIPELRSNLYAYFHSRDILHPAYLLSTMTKIFLTGATGYIGGDALYQLHQRYPDFEYALLIRSEDKATKVRTVYPNARIVIGGNDDSEVLEREAAWADIVVRMSTACPSLSSHGIISDGANLHQIPPTRQTMPVPRLL